MDLTEETYNSVNRYFSVLSHTGYKPDAEVDNLLIMCLIEELLYGPLSLFVTDEGYKIMDNAMYCLYGLCMIPFPDYRRSYDEYRKTDDDKYRITETGTYRHTEGSELRIESL